MIKDSETGESLSPQSVADQLVKELKGSWAIDHVDERGAIRLRHPAADDHAVFISIVGIDLNPQVAVYIRKEFTELKAGPLKGLKIREHIFMAQGRSPTSGEDLVQCIQELLQRELDVAIRATTALKEVVEAQQR